MNTKVEEMTANEQGLSVDDLAQLIRVIDGRHTMGAGALAEALHPHITAALASDTGERGVVAENERLKARLAEQSAAGFAWNGHMVHGDKDSVQAVVDALRAPPAQPAEAVVEDLATAIRAMNRPYHLTGGAEHYGFDHGKACAAKLVEKYLPAAIAAMQAGE